MTASAKSSLGLYLSFVVLLAAQLWFILAIAVGATFTWAGPYRWIGSQAGELADGLHYFLGIAIAVIIGLYAFRWVRSSRDDEATVFAEQTWSGLLSILIAAWSTDLVLALVVAIPQSEDVGGGSLLTAVPLCLIAVALALRIGSFADAPDKLRIPRLRSEIEDLDVVLQKIPRRRKVRLWVSTSLYALVILLAFATAGVIEGLALKVSLFGGLIVLFGWAVVALLVLGIRALGVSSLSALDKVASCFGVCLVSFVSLGSVVALMYQVDLPLSLEVIAVTAGAVIVVSSCWSASSDRGIASFMLGSHVNHCVLGILNRRKRRRLAELAQAQWRVQGSTKVGKLVKYLGST